MTRRPPFQHAYDAALRRDIALAVRAGISVDQLAEEFDISPATVRAYCDEYENTKRAVRLLSEHEREAIRVSCAHGGRRRWERQLGAEVVRQVLGEG